MTTIKIKRVYEKPGPSDGFLVLVDRLWPRGIKKENLEYDLWAKEITPSSELRKWYHEDMENRWKSFGAKYVRELESSGQIEGFLEKIRHCKTVTLLYAAKDEKQNHAIVLKEYLDRKLKT